MPAPVVVSQCFPIKTRLAPGCLDHGHHYDVNYVFPMMVRTTGQRWKQKTPLVALFNNVKGDDEGREIMLTATKPMMGIKITFLKILNSLHPDELFITLSPLLSGKVVFMIISKQETLATAACFH